MEGGGTRERSGAICTPTDCRVEATIGPSSQKQLLSWKDLGPRQLPGKAPPSLSRIGDQNSQTLGNLGQLTFESFSGARRMVLVRVEFEG